MVSLKESLRDKIEESKLNLVPSSFDQIGSIALFNEFPKELKKEEKIIANELLKINKTVKTVAIKSKKFSGKFRLQKVRIVAGIKTKETVHKENNITLKLNIEKTYFSQRSSSERARISKLIKQSESILVMFSGIGVFPLVISKNSKAKEVYGIELNSNAHKYALKNIEINKLRNVTLIQGDVKKVMPNFYQNILGLKGSIDQIPSRLKYNPKLFEFHLFPEDLIKNKKKLISAIKSLKKKGIKVFIHMPFLYNNKQIDLGEEHPEGLSIIVELAKLCKEQECFAIIHPSFDNAVSKEVIIKNISYLQPYFSYIFFETSSTKSFFLKEEDVLEIAKKAKIKNLAIDTAHLYKIYKSNSKVISVITNLQSHYPTYIHFSNSNGESEGDQLDKGKIVFEKVLPLITKGVLEIRNKNENDPKETINSFKLLKNCNKKFDRIVMPLPKDSESYLDLALNHLNKGGIIHFYDFAKEKEFPKSSINKIKKHCKNFKIVNAVKCGQYSPRTFRVCIDFQVD